VKAIASVRTVFPEQHGTKRFRSIALWRGLHQVRLSYVPRNREELDLSKRKAGHHSLTIREDVLLIHEGYADRKAGSAVAYFKAPDSGAVQRFEYLRGVR